MWSFRGDNSDAFSWSHKPGNLFGKMASCSFILFLWRKPSVLFYSLSCFIEKDEDEWAQSGIVGPEIH
jgi:hypothetical protein